MDGLIDSGSSCQWHQRSSGLEPAGIQPMERLKNELIKKNNGSRDAIPVFAERCSGLPTRKRGTVGEQTPPNSTRIPGETHAIPRHLHNTQNQFDRAL